MCMRFAREARFEELEKEFGLTEHPDQFRPNYNASPTQMIDAVVQCDGSNIAVKFKWRLVSSWSKAPSIGNKFLNARGETVAEKPSFREAFKKRRCLIPIDGYYEWVKRGDAKIPAYIKLT